MVRAISVRPTVVSSSYSACSLSSVSWVMRWISTAMAFSFAGKALILLGVSDPTLLLGLRHQCEDEQTSPKKETAREQRTHPPRGGDRWRRHRTRSHRRGAR